MELLLKYFANVSWVLGFIFFFVMIVAYKDSESTQFGISLFIFIMSVIYLLTYHNVI